jgi:hypothetical protein
LAAEANGSTAKIDPVGLCDNSCNRQTIYAQCEATMLIPRWWLQTRGGCHHIRRMCGRYASFLPAEALARLFGTTGPLPNLEPTWNMAPTKAAPIVRFDRDVFRRGKRTPFEG